MTDQDWLNQPVEKWGICDDAGCDKLTVRPDAMFCLEHMNYSPEELVELGYNPELKLNELPISNDG